MNAPANTLGLRRIMFVVDGLDEMLVRLRARGAELIGRMQYGDAYRLHRALGQPYHIELYCEAEGMVPMLGQIVRRVRRLAEDFAACAK